MADELAAPLAAYAGTTCAPNPGPRQEYARPDFWESRFQETDGMFDWYATYAELGNIFHEFCPPREDLKLLMVGCGNSGLSAELHHAGYRQIVNIDIAAAAVVKMENQFRDLNMHWTVMDATAMSFGDNSFGLTVDKGTLDAMMCGTANDHVSAMASEIYRTLQPGGIFMLVSHNGRRQQLLDEALAGHGPSARWEHLEIRRCRLSPQATLINVLRSRLKGRPLVEAFRDSEMMREAVVETKQTLKQMALVEAFRLFKARKMQKIQAGGGLGVGEAPAVLPREESSVVQPAGEDAVATEERDPRRQPFCWVYVLRKPHSAGFE